MKKYWKIKSVLVYQTLILLIILGIRMYFYFVNIPKYPDGTKVRIYAGVNSEPLIYSDSQYLKLLGYGFYLPLYPRIYYGDRITVEGEVQKGKLKTPRLLKVQNNNGLLYGFRKRLVELYQKSLPNDHSALIAGVVIGSKGGISEDLWKKLKNSGTAHVVVASGMNVSMIANFLVTILIIVIPRKKAVLFALLGIWLYAVISGFDAPIVRASVMGSIAFLAVGTGRMYLSLRSLFITCYTMLFIKPVWCTDLGFWLSAVATFSIIVFYPKVKKIFSFVPSVVNENWSTTLAAQIGVVPILYYFFGQFNILSSFINVAVLWTIVPITIIGIIGGIVGTIFEPLGKLVLLLAYPLTGWFIWIISLTG